MEINEEKHDIGNMKSDVDNKEYNNGNIDNGKHKDDVDKSKNDVKIDCKKNDNSNPFFICSDPENYADSYEDDDDDYLYFFE